ncbi:MAG TPA: hypothetical protein VGL72_28370 [Bryobacteraceae bacterium]|jgi:hypothetical protein
MPDVRKLNRILSTLVLIAVLAGQLIAFAPGHSADHETHCCPACHASHTPLLSAVPLLHFTPPSVRTYWRIASVALPTLVEAWVSGACTRGPPALSFAV